MRAIDNGESVALGGIDELGALLLDIVVEATGVSDVGARVALESLLESIGIATLTVESDVTVGRLMAEVATESGALYSVCRGDEPVETTILVDYARDLNIEVVCGMHGPPSTVPTLHPTFALEEDGGVLDRPGVVDYCTGPVAPGSSSWCGRRTRTSTTR